MHSFVKKIKNSRYTKIVYKMVFFLLAKLPAKKNTIVFESFSGKQYSDNPRAIYEYMRTQGIRYTMYWSADKRHINKFVGRDLNYIKRFSIKWLFIMARSKYWVINSRLPLWIPKPKHTVYLQTWHGTPLKKLGVDIGEVHMPGTSTVKYRENFEKASKKWDFLISPNAYSTDIFKQAFNFNKKLIETGYPRNDYLINNNNEEKINELKKNLDIPLNKKILLYAPTWRDNNYYSVGKYKFQMKLDINKLKKELDDEFVLILRMHYLVAEDIDISNFDGFVYNLSDYEDIRDLYLISDTLITDYSSVFFDYAILKRPIIFFVYDLEEYRDTLRGFYFDFENRAPGKLTKTTDGIIEQINNIQSGSYPLPNNYNEFYSMFCMLEDGYASKRVIERVFDDIYEK
ncbi:CDP-glycerol glycerophosphotransferase [Salinibacillus kushneri]|uniref:CDP-glycerol glycerophosphotransferase n=1 Tax=Salinibacillus kushneri TaxID=237682 RepID=A0A1I0JIH2_9BACI|nr:CDP-glycerol glycerophosphotransferase [Salinibacillus kushneri]